VSPLTLMAVHAHPDDESIGTGGTLARYAAEGMEVVLVTCTDGSCGDGPGGVKPGDPGHDRGVVAKRRRRELECSCAALGVAHLELLDFRDSGMMGWSQNDEPGSFWTTPVAEGAERLAGLIDRYRPQVLVTYNANGFYGHPDHIQAHRVTVAAHGLTAVASKLYYTAVPRSLMADFGRRLRQLGLLEGSGSPGGAGGEAAVGAGEAGVEPAEAGEGPRLEWGTPDEEVTTFIDVSAYADRKYDSLECHASQADNIFFLKMGREAFGQLMAVEAYVRAEDRTGAPVPEDDLFAGLR
jgi:LmbE family N-acetylglucosaminyl deacetylase